MTGPPPLIFKSAMINVHDRATHLSNVEKTKPPDQDFPSKDNGAEQVMRLMEDMVILPEKLEIDMDMTRQ